jgi:hypothetical protein
MYNQLIIFAEDANGNLSRNFVSTQDVSAAASTALAAIVAAYQGITGAKVVGWQFQKTAGFTGGFTSTPYPTVFDRAAFSTKSSSQTGKLDVVAPIAAIFESDSYTVNMAHSGVVALVSALEAGAAVGVAGSPIVGVPSGKRYKVRQGGP